jgi:hypothetical protein
MSGTTFTYPLAKRIVSSTKWTEEQRGIIPEIETPIIVNGNQDLLVRTSSTLPVGYTGAMAVQGEIVEQKQDGTYLPQMPIWIKDQNGGMLNSNTIYQARVGGTWTQNVTINGILAPTTLGLYLVQNAQTPSIAEAFKVISVSGGFTFIQTIDGTKSGKFAGSIWTPEIWVNIFNQFRPTVYGVAVFQPTIQYAIFHPFTLQVDAYYYASYSTGDTVTCAAPGGQGFFSAHDPLQLMRANGYRGRAIISYGTNSFGSVSYYPNGSSPFTVIAARQTDNFTTGGIGSGIGSGISGV